MPVKLVEVYRGDVLESIHTGSIVAVNTKGEIIFYLGNLDRVTFLHSAAKPLQALSFLESGIVEEYGFDLKEIAIMASSHSGEKEHMEALKSIIRKLDVDEDILQCGVHEPLGKDAARAMHAAGEKPSKLHCNCSGKHLGFIAASKIKGLSVDDYHKIEHDMQGNVKKVLSVFGDCPVSEIVTGIDGCSVPVYGMPLKNIALAYANLCSENFAEGKYRSSRNYILSAMTMYPEMIAGEGRFDTEVMKNFGDKVVTKMGAEGVCCICLTGKGIGLALKIEDGAARATEPVVLEALLQMGILEKEEMDKVKKFWIPPITSHKGEKIGEIRSVFRLK